MNNTRFNIIMWIFTIIQLAIVFILPYLVMDIKATYLIIWYIISIIIQPIRIREYYSIRETLSSEYEIYGLEMGMCTKFILEVPITCLIYNIIKIIFNAIF